MIKELKQVRRRRVITRKRMEKLHGWLQHATTGIPAGKGLMTPLNLALRQGNFIRIGKTSTLKAALTDWGTLLRQLKKRPTHVETLVERQPDYVGWSDASKEGAGGVWLVGHDLPSPIVWRVQWPQDIQNGLISNDAPEGWLSINDLEMAGMLLHWLVLENIVNIRHKHIGAWCDNSSSVAWIKKMASKRSLLGGRLCRALGLRYLSTEASPLLSQHVEGTKNTWADVSSRSFSSHPSDDEFLLFFVTRFPFSNQKTFWTMFHLNKNTTSKIFCELRNTSQPLGSWMRLTKKDNRFGIIGQSLQVMWESTPTYITKESNIKKCDKQSSHLEWLYDVAHTAGENKWALAVYPQPSEPSERQSKWSEGITHSYDQMANC